MYRNRIQIDGNSQTELEFIQIVLLLYGCVWYGGERHVISNSNMCQINIHESNNMTYGTSRLHFIGNDTLIGDFNTKMKECIRLITPLPFKDKLKAVKFWD